MDKIWREWEDEDDAQEAEQERLESQMWELTEKWTPALEAADEFSKSEAARCSKFEVRVPSEKELGLLFAWLRLDEQEFGEDERQWFSRAASSMLLAFETGRLRCAFLAGSVFPLGVVVRKEDFSIDVVVVRRAHRGKGIGRALVEHAIRILSRNRGTSIGAEDANVDDGYWYIEALPTAVGFWSRIGFQPDKDSPQPVRIKNKTCIPMRLKLEIGLITSSPR